METTIYTIGYGARTIDDFLRVLAKHHIAYLVDAFRFACLDLRAAVRNGDARQAHEASQNVICTKRRLDDLETYPTHTRRPQRAVKARE